MTVNAYLSCVSLSITGEAAIPAMVKQYESNWNAELRDNSAKFFVALSFSLSSLGIQSLKAYFVSTTPPI